MLISYACLYFNVYENNTRKYMYKCFGLFIKPSKTYICDINMVENGQIRIKTVITPLFYNREHALASSFFQAYSFDLYSTSEFFV